MDKNIFVIEDDDNIRELVTMALSSFSYQVTSFDQAEQALFQMESQLPDLVIFDIMLPGISGLEATSLMRNNPRTAQVPILLLTAKNTEMDTVAGLDQGADDYMSKPFSVMELAARVRALLRRTVHLDDPRPAQVDAGDLQINDSTRDVTQGGKPLGLTFKEYELLYLLIQHRTRILSREELLSTIWGYDFMGESRTLDIHIRTLRKKLGDDAETPRYIKTIRNVGYRFIGDASP
ncbi:MAG: response regulator transcription factor [Propionibacteriaceae bacterium]|nr:response regulator transcription factor [Propionibacteriaceae bacterium]